MITRFLEAFFRHKLLILGPPILMPLIVGPIALLMTPIYYESWAGVWVDRPTYLTYNDGWNQYNTPAQNQVGRLNERLRTRTFLMEVAKKTPLAPLTETPRGEEKIAEIVGKGLSIAPNGNQLVLMRFRGETPQLSFQIINALVETFKDQAANDRANQATLAISFYESRQQTAQDQYKQASDALRRYVAANPRLTTIDPNGGAGATAAARLGLPAAAIDPQLAELLRQQEVAKGELDRTRTSLDQARLDAAASMEGQEIGFQIVDAPRQATTATRERRKMLIYPIAALVIGLGISTSVLVLLVAGDHSVRAESDLDVSPDVVLGVPHFHVARAPKKAGPDAARRAVGFAAGMALTAPSGAK